MRLAPVVSTQTFDDLTLAGLPMSLAAYAEQPIRIRVGGQAPSEVETEVVSPTFFRVLGVVSAAGVLTIPSQPDAVIISYRLWRTIWNGSPSAIGATITVSGRPATVIGVTATAFRGVDRIPTDLWLSIAFAQRLGFLPSSAATRGGYLSLIGRAVGKVPPSAIAAAARSAVAHLNEPMTSGGRVQAQPVTVGSLADYTFDSDGALSRLLRATLLALVVALIAAAGGNAAILLLLADVRAKRETATRRALGASTGQLVVARMRTIGGLVWACGLAVTALVAVAAVVAERTQVADLAVVETWPGIVVFGTVALLGGVSLGCGPALYHEVRISAREAVHQGMASRGTTPAIRRTCGVLIAGQVMLGTVLLLTTTYLYQNIVRASRLDTGYDLAGTFAIAHQMGSADTAEFGSRRSDVSDDPIARALRAMPGVVALTRTATVPLESSVQVDFVIPPTARTPERLFPLLVNRVDENYFAALGIHILAGRTFTRADVLGARPVVVIDQATATALGDSDGLLGGCLFGANSIHGCPVVIGIVANTRYLGLWAPGEASVYSPGNGGLTEGHGGFGPGSPLIAKMISAGSANRIYQAIQAAGGDPSAYGVTSLATVARQQYRPWRVAGAAFATTSVVLLLLVGIGIVAVIRFEVQAQWLGLGVRAALGAPFRALAWHIAGRLVAWSLLGVAVAVLTQSWVLATVQHWVVGLQPVSLVQLAPGILTMLLILAVALGLPLVRVITADPASVLRTG